MPGIFTISLDFELHWGGFEKWPLTSRQLDSSSDGWKTYNQYFLNTRVVIPKMLSLFEKYQVHVTWAGVGMLFHPDRKSLEAVIPSLQPTYETKELAAYNYINTVGIGNDERADPFHFANSLVKLIINTTHQELGSHTFAHFYCNEAGQTLEQFRADLKAAQQSAAMLGKQLRSLVFPRNQFNDAYLKVCFEEGFTSVRSNPVDWFWNIESTQHESAWKRLNRGLDAYFPVGHKNTYSLSSLPVRDGFPVCIPASRLLRPYRPKEFFLNEWKIQRIKSEMWQAAKSQEAYHLWWHPHNFGNYPEQSLEALETILKHYQLCSEKYEMISLNMGEVTDVLLSSHGKNQVA